jgi:hypothetical protein
MKKTQRTIGMVLVGLLMACATGRTAGYNWEFLGRRDVDTQVDRDVIEVGRREGRFRALKFTVRGGAIELYEVKVVLGDGETFRPAGRMVFERGEERYIDLPGDRRSVRKVEFLYRALRSGGSRHATVTLYGRP